MEKQHDDGTLFRCEAIHFEGEGLIQVFRIAADDEGDFSVQFSVYGEPLAILTLEGQKERLFYERDMGYGRHDVADEMAVAILKGLEHTLTEEEAMSYLL